MITFEEKLDKLLAKKNQTEKTPAKSPGKTNARCKTKPEPMSVSDVTFYLLYL